ncbi:MAG: type I-A CRISPR-associated protein Cas4/Csa1 [Pyrobaculum sp.]
MLTLFEISRLLRRGRLFAIGTISPELRGWAYQLPPVRPPAYLGLALSDFAYGYCPTMRNVYLRYVLGERGVATKPLLEGRILHDTLSRAMEDYKLYALSGRPMSPRVEDVADEFRPKAEVLYRHVAARLLGEHAYVVASGLARSRDAAAFYVAPMATNVAIDGSPLGLSYVVPDGITVGAVVEFKFGPSQNVDVALAGYAMAVEAEYNVPIDYGIYVNIFVNNTVEYRTYVYYLNDQVRQKFLQMRDRAIEIVTSKRDPGVAESCSKYCPFYHICHR